MKRLRRTLLEIWAIAMLAVLTGFLGPFGTYTSADFPSRVVGWWVMLIGAYLLVRPTILFWRWIARATELPRGSLVFWGVTLSSFPMAWLWLRVGRDETRLLDGYWEMIPFALLCALGILAVEWWTERADAHLARYYGAYQARQRAEAEAPIPQRTPERMPAATVARPRLHERLSPGFGGEILALESEDHYVRVHGAAQSELLFLRLRDAIAEMDGRPGEQTHRSWWIARDAVAGVTGNARSLRVLLTNGLSVPVARDSVERLQAAGFLPD